MLPKPILDELFNLHHRAGDMVIQHLCEDVESLGCTVYRVENNDASLDLKFREDDKHIDGDIRIDRLFRLFTVCVRVGDATFLPASGDWITVRRYVDGILNGT
jgi:hypothetical protein